jgi:hypothetical protein
LNGGMYPIVILNISVMRTVCLIVGVLRKEILGITFPGRKCIDGCFLQRTVLEHRVGVDPQTDRGLFCTGIHMLFIEI